MKSISRVRPFVTPWTVAHQAPQSMEFSRQEYWSGLLAALMVITNIIVTTIIYKNMARSEQKPMGIK